MTFIFEIELVTFEKEILTIEEITWQRIHHLM